MIELSILTQNLHCLVEEDIENKQNIIADEIAKKHIDIVFLQEVAQSMSEDIQRIKITPDNYGLKLKSLLEDRGFKYNYYYEPIKESFGKYDEGVGILSKFPLEFFQSKTISRINEYSDWKTRKILTYRLNMDGRSIYLATTHFGWSDGYEIFEEQFDRGVSDIFDKELSILAGDFNIIPTSKEYLHIKQKLWFDVFLNTDFFNKPTFRGDDQSFNLPTRIDYIMTNKKVQLVEKEILFIDQRVSDHFGVFAKIKI